MPVTDSVKVTVPELLPPKTKASVTAKDVLAEVVAPSFQIEEVEFHVAVPLGAVKPAAPPCQKV